MASSTGTTGSCASAACAAAAPEHAAARLPDSTILRRPAGARARPRSSPGSRARFACSAIATARTWGASTTPSPRTRPILSDERGELRRATAPTTARANATRARPVLGPQGERQARHRDQPRAVRRERPRASSSAACISDGQTEVYSFTSADRSLLVRARPPRARRGTGRFDIAGAGVGARLDLAQRTPTYLAWAASTASSATGRSARRPRASLDVFYSFNLLRAVWLSARLPAHHEPRLQRRPRPGRHPRREGACRVLRDRGRGRRRADCRRRARARALLAPHRRARSRARRDSPSSASIRRRPAAGWLVMDDLVDARRARRRGRGDDRLRACPAARDRRRAAPRGRLRPSIRRRRPRRELRALRLYAQLHQPARAAGAERHRRRLRVHGTRGRHRLRTPTRVSDARLGFDARLLGDARRSVPTRRGRAALRPLRHPRRLRHRRTLRAACSARSSPATSAACRTRRSSACTSARSTSSHARQPARQRAALRRGRGRRAAHRTRAPSGRSSSGPRSTARPRCGRPFVEQRPGSRGCFTGRVEGTRATARLRLKLGVGGGLNPRFGAPEWRIVAGIEVSSAPRSRRIGCVATLPSCTPR